VPKYKINCDCCSYVWERRRPPQAKFLKCRGCGRKLGDMQVTEIKESDITIRKKSEDVVYAKTEEGAI
jgi:hypothetical protein